MSALTFDTPTRSLAQVLKSLGNIPPERIRLPVGVATEKDLIDGLEAAEKRLCELVDGVLVEKVMGMRESIIAGRICHFFWNFLEENDRGIAFAADGPIRLRLGRIRMPDAGVIAWKRFPNRQLPEGPIWDVIPDLAVEVISKGNTAEEMELKLTEYFEAGVRLVWYVYPSTQSVAVYSSPTSKNVFGKDDILDGGKVLPGFALPVAALFIKKRKK